MNMGTYRVLHIIDSGGPGGAETVLDTVVRGLPADAWRSRVLVGFEDWLTSRLEEQGVDFGVVPSARAADFDYLGGLVREIRGFRPDVIHAHLLGSGVYGTIAAVLAGGAPLVCTLHGRPDVPDPDRFRALKARVLSRPLNRVAYVSYDLREWAEPLLGVPPHLGVVIHNGVTFPEPSSGGDLREELGAGPDVPLVGAVGNVRPAKDYDNFVRAAALVHEARPEVRFVIIGDERSELTPPLERLAAERGVDDHLHFLGFRPNVSSLVRSLDVFVSSSYTEGLPLATVEAVATETPVVLTRVGGVPEVVESGVTGLLVPPSDPSALARGIIATLADPARAKAMAKAGSIDVRARFAARRMCEDYEDLYRKLIRAAGAG